MDELLSQGTGGLLLLLPKTILSQKTREAIMKLEEHITSQEFEIPIYFAPEDDELLDLEKELNSVDEGSKKKGKSAAQGLY